MAMKKQSLGLFAILLFLSSLSTAQAAVKQEVYVTGHVRAFGGYQFTETVAFEVKDPGKQVIGEIVVEGLYNGPYPWIMRVYTDNYAYSGVTGAIKQAPSSGLVSKNGAYTIPLWISSPSLGEDAWRKIPDLSDTDQTPYEAHSETGDTFYTDCVVLGIDPRNGNWVAGGDGLIFTADDNTLGDITVPTPFAMELRADVAPSSVNGNYETTLYMETVSAP